jgi:hypothetical protein
MRMKRQLPVMVFALVATLLLLKGAAKAAASGDYDLAIELANEAGLHAQLALATAAREKQTWQNNVPK